MKVFIPFLVVLTLSAAYLADTDVENKTRQKRKVAVASLGNAQKVGSFVISTSLSIMSLVTGYIQHSESKEKLSSIQNIVHQIREGMTMTQGQLTTILHKLEQSTYVIAIAEDEREIKHCFEVLDTYVYHPSKQQSIDNMMSCTSIMKNVKEIGRILGGETVGPTSEGLFDMIIREHGHCNGTVIKDLSSYLKQLLFQGCSAVVAAEVLKYGNSSSQYQRHCTAAFNKTDDYAEKLYRKCSNEDCAIIHKNMKFVLQEVNTSIEAREILSSQFPWYYFQVIVTMKCRKECFQENFKSTTPRPFPFNLHTFLGKDNLILVLYHDKRYATNKIGKSIGFQVPRSCLLDYSYDLDISTCDGQGVSEDITYYMNQNTSVSSSANICESTATKCGGSNVGSMKIIRFYTVAIIVLMVVIF